MLANRHPFVRLARRNRESSIFDECPRRTRAVPALSHSAAVLALAAISASCGTDAIPTAPAGPEQNRLVAEVLVAPGDLILAPDETATLDALVLSARGRQVNGRLVTWSSSDPTVAQIDGQGRLFAGNEGSATIVATVEGVVGTARLDVRGDVVAIDFEDPFQTMTEGSRRQIVPQYIYSNGAVRTADRMEWNSSDRDIISVDGEGVATALGTGDVRIEARGRNRQKTLEVSVNSDQGSEVEASHASATIQVGQTVQLWAEVKNSDGERLKRKISWSSSNAGVATVDQRGNVRGQSPGDAVIQAAAGNLRAEVEVSVTAAGATTQSSSGPSAPDAVTDLSVVSTTDHSVTIRFSEVDDGTGQPAGYQVRYLQGTSGSPWSDGVDVQHGSCLAPVEGSAIGRQLTCVIDGLQASRNYRVQLVAFRGGSVRVFGGLSNIASGQTESGGLTVAVFPSAFTIDVGDSRQLTAEVRDAFGNTVNQSVSWSSSRSTIATVSGAGLTAGQAAGSATIRASASGVSGSSAATVRSTTTTNPGTNAGGGRNEPAGFRPMVDQSFASLTEDGWKLQSQNRNTTIEQDQSAPVSGPYVLRQFWPAGCGSGTSCNNWVEAPTWNQPSEEAYLRFFFKYSPNWQGHDGSGINKLFYLSMAGYQGNIMAVNVYGVRSDPLRLRPTIQSQDHGPCGLNGTARNLDANTGNGRIDRGRWYEVEIYVKTNTPGNCDGVFRAWINGQKTHDYNVVFIDPSDSFSRWNRTHENPIWGGQTGYTADQDMWIMKDHLYVSVR